MRTVILKGADDLTKHFGRWKLLAYTQLDFFSPMVISNVFKASCLAYIGSRRSTSTIIAKLFVMGRLLHLNGLSCDKT